MVSSCGNTDKKGTDGALNDKKADLEKLKSDKAKLDEQIGSLEKEIAKLDTSAGVKEVPKLVAIAPIQLQDFKHYSICREELIQKVFLI